MPDPVIAAYQVSPSTLRIIPASADREWMTRTAASSANRCLPLRIANQFGWFILGGETVEAVWSGRHELGALQIRFLDGRKSENPTSHFGHGILTWHIPFLFRTPPGYNLVVRGPTNWPKDGAVALDGVVETDWAVATFTMNWKLTCVDTPVTFHENEPICMIAPVLRGQLESFAPEIRSLDEDPQLKLRYEAWSKSRENFLRYLSTPSPAILWEKHYFKGTSPGGDDDQSEHQTRLKLRPFVDHRAPANSSQPILSDASEDPLRIRRQAKSLLREVYHRITARKS